MAEVPVPLESLPSIAIAAFAAFGSHPTWLAGVIVLGIGTAIVNPTLLAASAMSHTQGCAHLPSASIGCGGIRNIPSALCCQA